MHRYLLRLHCDLKSVFLFLLVAALPLCTGCGFVYPPPAIPDVIKGEVFHEGEPIALLTFEPGRTGGKIIGQLHEWPFPHLEKSQGIPTGNFSYVGQFKVYAKSDDDGMPSGAEGTRKVYFHEQSAHLDFAEAPAYATGQEVALDTISMTFSFRENHRLIAVRMVAQQKSADPFTYRGQKVDPPKDRRSADTFHGDYSPDLGGYILRGQDE